MVQYELVRSRNRHRSVSMKIDGEGKIVVRAPVLMPKFFIDRFVTGHQDWIDKQQKARSKPRSVQRKYFSTQADLEIYIRKQVSRYSEETGLHPTRLRFRHVKSYWGSCSPSSVISFNRHLEYAPPEAVNYVIVHELCHLKYRGHGKRFWDLVTRYYPRQNEMRQVLRQITRE